MKNEYFKLVPAIVAIGLLVLGPRVALAQSVGIAGTVITPDAQSILEIESTAKGVLLPRMTTAQRDAISPTGSSDYGLLIFNLTTSTYDYWDGSAWQQVGTGTGNASTLDEAYDGGGPGVGRTITGDAGALEITGTGGAVALSTDGDIQLSLDDAWIGAGSTIERIIFDQSLTRINLEAADVTLTDGKWLGIDASNPNLLFQGGATDRLNVNNADITIDNGKWLGIGSSVERIEFDGTGNEINILGANVGIGTAAPAHKLDVAGDINLTAALRANGSAGTASQVLTSPGGGGAVIWATPSGDISSVIAGDALTGGGTAGDVTLDVAADNGLNVDAAADRVQLGGALTEATAITHGAYDLTLNLNSTGEFVVQDGGTDHFKVAANGDAIFGSDTYFKDTNTGGTDLVKVSDAGTGGDDGRIEVFSNGTVSHTINGDGNTVFNEQGLARDLRIESDNQTNMFIVDGSADAVGIGTATPDRELHVIGDVRISSLSAGGNVQADSNGDLIISNDIPGGDTDYIWNQTASAQTTANFWISSDGRLDGGLTVGAGATLDNNSTNTGTVAAGALAFGNTSSEGIASKRNAGGNQFGLDFYTNSINRMAITNGGNVGIGTTSPDRKVKVSGSGWTAIEIEETGASDAALELTSAGGSSYVFAQNAGHLGLQSPAGREMRFQTDGGTEQMRIESGGNVGIGTATPDARLNIGGVTGASIYLTRESGNTTAQNDVLGSILFDSTDDTQPSSVDASAGIRAFVAEPGGHGNSNKGGHLTFFTKPNSTLGSAAASERLRVTQDGNIGIGTTSPGAKLEVSGNNSGILIRSSTADGGQVEWRDASSTRHWNIDQVNNGRLRFFTEANDNSAGAERVTFLENGRVGIGTSSPQAMLHVSGSGVSQTNSYGWLNSSGSTGTCGGCAATYSIQADGRIRATEFNAISDMRIKNVVGHTATSALLGIVNKLRVTKYSYIDMVLNGSRAKEGLIAQEVEKVVPEAVKKSTDYIPSVFSNSSRCSYDPGNRTLTITLNAPHGLEEGDEVKLFDGGSERYASVSGIIDRNTFAVSGWDIEVERIFVYGRKVNDFRAIDYGQLFSIGIGAIQELSRQNDDLNGRVKELESAVEGYRHLEAELKTVKNLVDRLDADVNAKAQK